MVSEQAVIKVLADGKYHSGTELGEHFGVSRAAIAKIIDKIEQNYNLTLFAVKGKGYRLQYPLDLLDADKITNHLSSQTRLELSNLELHFDIDSTNRYLNQKNNNTISSGYVVLAEQQKSGQGRRGRTWVSPFAANIYLSVLWRFQSAPAELGNLSLLVAVAVVRALKQQGIEDVGVKWPNDILWQNKKLAGILLEMRGEMSGPSNVVIGVGINVAMPGDKVANDIDQPWIDIETILNKKVDRNALCARVIDDLFTVLRAIPGKQESLMREWQQLDMLKGQQVDVLFADRVIEAKALGINQDGSLRLLHKGKEIDCHSGEVSIRRREQ